jgi:hypothetical protein
MAPESYKPQYTPETLKEIREMLGSKDVEIDPWKRMFYSKFLDAYSPITHKYTDEEGKEQEKKVPTKFSERYDKYYSPFLTGANAATRRDLIPNTYQEVTPFDNIHQIKNKYRHNESINRLAAADPFVTAGAHGAGLAAATAFGGIPGLVGGMAIKHGAPLVWDLVKQRMAKRAGMKEEAASRYRKIRNKYPVF